MMFRQNQTAFLASIFGLSICSLITASILLLPSVKADEDCEVLAVKACEVNGNKSVRSYFSPPRMLGIGVDGMFPFEVYLDCATETGVKQAWLALSDGEVLELPDFSIQYRCIYLQSIYGLVIARLADGSLTTIPILLSPAWDPEDEKYIPEYVPDYAMPIAGHEPTDELILNWWEEIVLPDLEARGISIEVENVSQLAD